MNFSHDVADGSHQRTQSQRGFTLIELIVTMVIVGTLAAIAIPSYSSYVLQSHRAEAKSALLDLASLEERFFSVNNFYTANPQNLGYGGTSTTPPFNIGTDNYYQVVSITVNPAVPPPNSTSSGTPANFTITANAINNQLSDTACFAFTVNSIGQQTAQNSAMVDNSATCWAN